MKVSARRLLLSTIVLFALASAAGSWAGPVMPPVVVTPPSIIGRPVVGVTLLANPGTWGNNPTSFTYQWQRCNRGGDLCNPVAGGILTRYTVRLADSGSRLRVEVTATNAAGSILADSAETAVVTGGGPPKATHAPRISGTYAAGHRLTASPGDWTMAPTAWGYQWQHCKRSSDICSNIRGATGDGYGLTVRDVGYRIRVRVTATNADGSGSADSAIGPLVVGPPRSVKVPAISELITVSCVQFTCAFYASRGRWAGDPTEFFFQWQRCDATKTACFNIPRATSSAHYWVVADFRHRLRVEVSARNKWGTSTAISAITAIVVLGKPSH